MNLTIAIDDVLQVVHLIGIKDPFNMYKSLFRMIEVQLTPQFDDHNDQPFILLLAS